MFIYSWVQTSESNKTKNALVGLECVEMILQSAVHVEVLLTSLFTA